VQWWLFLNGLCVCVFLLGGVRAAMCLYITNDPVPEREGFHARRAMQL
jgi:hypothetical protein